MSGWFELSKSSDGQFRFVLKAGNGEIILTSELYTSKSAAENGIAPYAQTAPWTSALIRKRPRTGSSISI